VLITFPKLPQRYPTENQTHLMSIANPTLYMCGRPHQLDPSCTSNEQMAGRTYGGSGRGGTSGCRKRYELIRRESQVSSVGRRRNTNEIRALNDDIADHVV